MDLDWIDEFKAAQSDGTLPLDNIGTGMRYKRAFIWQVDLGLGGISGRIGKGSWEVTFTAPGGKVLFHQVVELQLMLIALGSFGLFFFTWNYVKDVFQTDIIDGVGVDKSSIGTYLLGGTAFSEQGDLQPASGFDNTNQTATIIADWFSPVYLFPSGIPVGTKVTIKADSWGFGPKSVEYGWAFGKGGAPLRSLFHAESGQTFLLHTNGGDLKIARSRRMQPALGLRPNEDDPEQKPALLCDYEKTVTSGAPLYAELHRLNGVLYCVALKSDELQWLRSTDEGENWNEVVAVAAEALNMTVLESALDSTGAVLYLYGTAAEEESALKLKQGDAMFAELKNEGKTWKLGARGKVEGANLPTQNIAGLEYSGGTLRLTARDGTNSVRVLLSTDGLRSLKAMAIS